MALCEFEACFVYRVSSRPLKANIVRPCYKYKVVCVKPTGLNEFGKINMCNRDLCLLASGMLFQLVGHTSSV